MEGREFPEPILVTGAPRSGTSLTTGILRACGAWVGTQREQKINPKGMMENVPVKAIVYRLFEEAGAIRAGRQHVGNTNHRPEWDLRKTVLDAVRNDGYVGGPWTLKEHKFLLTPWAWMEAFPTSKWIFVRRDSDSIWESNKKRGMAEKEHNRVLEHALQILREMKLSLPVEQWFEVWPADWIKGDWKSAIDMVIWAGLNWDWEAVQEWVEPKLWHHRK